MIPLSDGDIVSVNVECFVNDQQDLLTLHYRATIPGASADFADVVDNWFLLLDGPTLFNDVYTTVLSTAATNVTWWFQKVYNVRFVRYMKIPSVVDGQAGGAPLPQNVAACITLRGENVGRSKRATKHIGAIPSPFVADGYINALGLAGYVPLKNRMTDRFDVYGDGSVVLTPIVYHRSDPPLSEVIFSGAVMSSVRILRRRTVGLGT